MPPVEGDEKEIKERKGLKILTRLPILLAQINAGSNS